MALQLDYFNKIIKVTEPTIDVDAQSLHDFVEDEMASPTGMVSDGNNASFLGDILKPEGKIEDDNNPGVFSQIILVLNPEWQVQFWLGSGYSRIYGGKFVGGLNGQVMKATGGAGDITVLESQVDGVIVSAGLSTAQDAKLTAIDEEVKYIERWIHTDTEKLTQGIGTQKSPFYTLDSALTYMEANNLLRMHAVSDLTIDRNLKNFAITGVGLPNIDLNAQNMDNTTIERCKITGSYTGDIQATESAIINLSGMAGVFLTVTATGTLTVAPNSNLLISRVAPALAGQAWTLSMNSGQASQASVHNISGELVVTNLDNVADLLHLHFSQGELTIDASCTDGTIVYNGAAVKVTNNSVGVNIIDNTLMTIAKDTHAAVGLIPTKEENALALLDEINIITT